VLAEQHDKYAETNAQLTLPFQLVAALNQAACITQAARCPAQHLAPHSRECSSHPLDTAACASRLGAAVVAPLDSHGLLCALHTLKCSELRVKLCLLQHLFGCCLTVSVAGSGRHGEELRARYVLLPGVAPNASASGVHREARRQTEGCKQLAWP